MNNILDSKVIKRSVPLALLVGMSLALPGVAAAAPAPMVPTIGSTAGTGPKGCVYFTKFVGFRVTPGSYSLESARVLLDGVEIGRKSFAVVGRRQNRPSLLPVTPGFSWVVNVHRLKAGRHTLKLVATGRLLFDRIATGAATLPAPAVTASTSKPIVKCA